MRILFLLATILLKLTLAVSAQSAAGVVGREVPDQVGVFEVRVQEASDLQAGDILTVLRNGEPQGEAVVLSVEGVRLRVSTKGATEARPGDEVRFARRPVAQAARLTQAASEARQSGSCSDPSPPDLSPAKLQVTRGEIYIAPTGYVRVQVTVRNTGEQMSRPDTLECRWSAFGRPHVVDTLSIPPLAPGEAQTYTVFSMIRADPDVVNQPRDSIYAEGAGLLRPTLRLGSER